MPARQDAGQGWEFASPALAGLWHRSPLRASRVSSARFPCRSFSLLNFSSSQLGVVLDRSGRAWYPFAGEGSQARLGNAPRRGSPWPRPQCTLSVYSRPPLGETPGPEGMLLSPLSPYTQAGAPRCLSPHGRTPGAPAAAGGSLACPSIPQCLPGKGMG